MPTKRTSMKKIREILRLALDAQLTLRAIARVLQLSIGAIQKVVSQAKSQALTWEQVQRMSDAELSVIFYPPNTSLVNSRFQLPDWPTVYQELKRKGITRQLLWEEYAQLNPDNHCSYLRYCRLYKA